MVGFSFIFHNVGGSLKSLESLNSWESLKNGLFWKDPFSKNPMNEAGTWSGCARDRLRKDLLEVLLPSQCKKKKQEITELLRIRNAQIRERKLNTNFFFLKLFGHPRDIPAKSRDIPPKKFDFPGFEGHTELFGPQPFVWKTPTPPENIRTQKFRFGFLFRAWQMSIKSFCPLGGPLRLRVQSRWRTRLRIAASIAFLFRTCFKGVLDTIAPLSRGWARQAV